jgi:AcrR family transcriptional regulator
LIPLSASPVPLIPPTPAIPAHNKHGQVLGGKGRRSRERIIVETVELLRDTPVGELTMVAIVGRAGVTKAAFYLYFDDVAEVVLAALEDATQEFAQVAHYVARPWPSERLFEGALAFVHAYFGVWTRHMAVLRARNVLADSGDERFVASRGEASRAAGAALTEKLAPCQGPGTDVQPKALAKVLLTALERSATVTAMDLHGRSVEYEQTSRALAHLFALAIQPGDQAKP